MSSSRALLLIATFLSIGIAAHAETAARIIDTAPSSPMTFGERQSFWIRIAYETDHPVNLWARPYRDGVQVREAMSNASMSYMGAGEALGWFALTEPGSVDQVRIIAGGGSPYREWEVARRTVDLRWTSGPVGATVQPEWVTDLLEADRVRSTEDAERRAQEPLSAGEVAFFNGFMLIMLALLVAGIGVPLWYAWKWQGGWRWAASVPAAVMGFVVLRIVVDTTRDPTSHNLWPFEILQFGVGALLIVGALRLLRRWRRLPA